MQSHRKTACDYSRYPCNCLLHLLVWLTIYHQFKSKSPKTANEELALCTEAPDRTKVQMIIQMDTVVSINVTTQFETCLSAHTTFITILLSFRKRSTQVQPLPVLPSRQNVEMYHLNPDLCTRNVPVATVPLESTSTDCKQQPTGCTQLLHWEAFKFWVSHSSWIVLPCILRLN